MQPLQAIRLTMTLILVILTILTIITHVVFKNDGYITTVLDETLVCIRKHGYITPAREGNCLHYDTFDEIYNFVQLLL